MKLATKKDKAIHDAFARERAADLMRGRLIDRLETGFETGELAELINEWRGCLEECGHDPIDLMRAVQNTLFPEAFFAPECMKDIEFSLVPRKGGSATSTAQMMAFCRTLAAKKRKPK